MSEDRYDWPTRVKVATVLVPTVMTVVFLTLGWATGEWGLSLLGAGFFIALSTVGWARYLWARKTNRPPPQLPPSDDLLGSLVLRAVAGFIALLILLLMFLFLW